MAIQNFLPDLTHIARTTYQWEHTVDKYEVIPEGVLCIEFVSKDTTLIKIGNGHQIYKQLPYVSSIDLSNYYTKEETDAKIVQIFNELKSLRIKGEVNDLSDLPTRNNTEGDVWFVKRTSPSGYSRYDEYVWYKQNWESIGLAESDIDLSQYAKKEYVDEKIAEVDSKIDRYMHTHPNKEILDQTDAIYNTEKDEKLASLHNYDDTEIRELIEERTHTHSNKSILDQTTAPFTTQKDNKLESLHNYDDTEIQDRLEILEQIAHYHENMEVLNRTTAAFTREQAITLLDCKDFEGTDGTNDGYHGFVPAPTAADAGKVLGANGQWVPMSGGGGGDTVAEGGGISITTDVQTGDKVISVNAGTGLEIDPVTGELNVTGGGGGSGGNYSAGEAIEFDTESETSDIVIDLFATMTDWVNKAYDRHVGGNFITANEAIHSNVTPLSKLYKIPEPNAKFTIEPLDVNDNLLHCIVDYHDLNGGHIGWNGEFITNPNTQYQCPTGAVYVSVAVVHTNHTSPMSTSECKSVTITWKDITTSSTTINVKHGDGLTVNQDNELEVDLGNGLQFDANGAIETVGGDYTAGKGIFIGNEYQNVEYIKNSGNYDQIILTDIVPSSTDRFEMDIKFGAASGLENNKAIYGAIGTNQRYDCMIWMNDIHTYTSISTYNHFTWQAERPSNVIDASNTIKYEGNNPRQLLTVTRNTVTWGNVTTDFSDQIDLSYTELNIPIAIFGKNVSNTSLAPFVTFELTVYGVKLYDSNDTLLHNLVPVKKLSNNEGGLYDTVTNKFYGNSGGGSFVTGPAVETDDRIINAKIGNGLGFDSNNAIEVVTGDGLQINQDGEVEIDPSIIPEVIEYSAGEAITILSPSGSILPPDYIEMDYIENGSSASYTFIDYIPNRKTKIIGSASLLSTEYDPVVFGCRTGSNGQQFVFWFNKYDSTRAKVGFVYGTNTWSTSTDCDDGKLIPYTMGEPFTFLISLDDEFNVNDSFVHNITENGAPASNLRLGIFALINSSSGSIENNNQVFVGRMYEFKIYEDNVLVVNLVPAINTSTNGVGFYDTVNDKFYTSKTSTPFICDTPSESGSNYSINVKHGEGLEVNNNNELRVVLSNGLQFDPNASETMVADNDYFFNTRVSCQVYTSDYYSTHHPFSRTYQKTTNEPVLCCIWEVADSGALWTGPLFVGLTETSVQYTTQDTSQTVNYQNTFTYLGKTWYTSGYPDFLNAADHEDKLGHLQYLGSYAAVSDQIQAAKDLIDIANTRFVSNAGIQAKLGSGLSFDANGAIQADAQPLSPATDSTLGGVIVGDGILVDIDGTISVDPTIIPEIIEYEAGTAISIDEVEHGGVSIDAWDSGTGWSNWAYTSSTGDGGQYWAPEVHSSVANSWKIPLGATQVRVKAFSTSDVLLHPTIHWLTDQGTGRFGYADPTGGMSYDSWLEVNSNATYMNLGIRRSEGSTVALSPSEVKSVELTFQTVNEIEVDVWNGGTGWLNGDYTSGTSDSFVTNWYYTYHYNYQQYIEVPEGATHVMVMGVSNENDSHFEGGGVNAFDSNHHHVYWWGCAWEWHELSSDVKYVQPNVKWDDANSRTISGSDVKSVTLVWKLPALETNQAINVKYGDGLTVNQNNELEVNIGSGLQFDANGALEVVGGGGDTIAEGDGISITDDLQTGDKIISVNYGDGLTIDPVTGALMFDGQLPEGTIIKKLTYMGDGGATNNIQFEKKPIAILSIYGAGQGTKVSSCAAPIDAPVLNVSYGTGNGSNSAGMVSCTMSYNDSTNVLSLTGGNDPGVRCNMSGETYTVYYLIKGHTEGGTSATNEVSVIKTITYTGTGTTTNNIQLPETPNYILGINGRDGVSGDMVVFPFDPNHPSSAHQYIYTYCYNSGISTNYFRGGHGEFTFNSSTNILTLTGGDQGAACNYLDRVYYLRYVVNETISGGGGSGSYEPGTAIEFSNQERKMNPAMTSDILPYGEVIESGHYSTRYGWNAFDGTDSQTWQSHCWGDGTNALDNDPDSCYVGYVFTEDVYLDRFVLSTTSDREYTAVIQTRSEGVWTTVCNVTVPNTRYDNNVYTLQSPVLCDAFRFAVLSSTVQYWTTRSYGGNVCNFEAYGYGESRNQISVKYGDGLTVNNSNELEVNLGSGLSFDANGAIQVTGGGSGDIVAQGGGILITTDQQTGEKIISVNAGSGLAIDQNTGELEVSSGVVTSIAPTQNTPGAITITEGDGTTSSVQVLSAMGGATSSTAGTAGYVPAPSSGDDDAYLRGDGTWDDDVVTENDLLTFVFVPDNYTPPTP